MKFLATMIDIAIVMFMERRTKDFWTCTVLDMSKIRIPVIYNGITTLGDKSIRFGQSNARTTKWKDFIGYQNQNHWTICIFKFEKGTLIAYEMSNYEVLITMQDDIHNLKKMIDAMFDKMYVKKSSHSGSD